MKKSFLFRAVAVTAALAIALSCTKEGNGDNNGNEGNEGGNGNTEYEYALIAAPQALSFGWNQPAAQSVTVTTNSPAGFTVGQPADWYTAVANGNKVIITPSTNEGDARFHELVLSAEGAPDVKILVNQDKKGEIPSSLQGSKYIVWQLDQSSAEYLGNKIILNLGENGTTCFFYIWPAGDSLVGDETASGPGFYGYMTGYMALQVGNIGWSGAGYVFTDAKGTEGQEGYEDQDITLKPVTDQIMADNGEGWFFHAAVKGTPGAGSYFTVCGNSDAEGYKVAWDDYNITANDWTEIEVPMSNLISYGWTGFAEETNNLVVGSGSTPGQKVHFDAVFIYKK